MKHRLGLFGLVAVLLFAAVAALVAAAGPSDPPPGSKTRRPITPREKERLALALGTEQAELWANVHAFGISTKLSEQELERYRRRGTNEAFLLDYVAEYGISPEEDAALRAAGLDLAVAQVLDATGYHLAAFADVIVLGRVAAVTGNPAGPYHSHYQFAVETYLKNCSPAAPPTIEGKLLGTGPRPHGGHLHQVEDTSEPNLEEGERVIVLLSKTPLALIRLLQAPANDAWRSNLEREYGTLPELVRLAEAPVGLEVLTAWKVVGQNAVWKLRALHAPNPSEVVPVSEFSSRIKAIADAQEPFCRGRYQEIAQ